jgi:hypothetical protein
MTHLLWYFRLQYFISMMNLLGWKGLVFLPLWLVLAYSIGTSKYSFTITFLWSSSAHTQCDFFATVPYYVFTQQCDFKVLNSYKTSSCSPQAKRDQSVWRLKLKCQISKLKHLPLAFGLVITTSFFPLWVVLNCILASGSNGRDVYLFKINAVTIKNSLVWICCWLKLKR